MGLKLKIVTNGDYTPEDILTFESPHLKVEIGIDPQTNQAGSGSFPPD
jgi:hypothetical protein